MAMLREASKSPPQQDPCHLSPSSDEVLVAEMLMRLSQPQAQRLSPPPTFFAEFTPLRWGFQQRRSRQVARCGSNYEKKSSTVASQKGNTAASPTTPLSWSGTTCGASFSGGGGVGGGNSGAVGGSTGDGSDSSSHCVKPVKIVSSSSRLKVAARGVGQSRLPTRRVSKKKTPLEWKDEVNSLSTEKIGLEKEVERLRKRYSELKDQNESLKNKLNLWHAKNTVKQAPATFKKVKHEPVSFEHVAAPPSNIIWLEQICSSPPVGSPKPQEMEALSASCILPDLNIPLGDDYS